MQTFLPYPNFVMCAHVLDNVRLNKQITECKQILSALLGESEGWKNHPAVRMWDGHEPALCFYGLCMYCEWHKRRDIPGEHKSGEYLVSKFNWEIVDYPHWLRMHWIHETHQSRLMHKGSVDVLKTRFGKTRVQKLNYLNVREHYAPDMPKEWALLLPDQVKALNRLLDELGYPQATKTNHYKFNIGPEHAYIWPDTPGKYKVLHRGKWLEWKPGDNLPLAT